MNHDIVRFFQTLRLARKRPRAFGPAVLAVPMVVLPLLTGAALGRRAAAAAVVGSLLLVALYAFLRLHPLVPYIPPPRRRRAPLERALGAVFRRPLGAMLVMTVGDLIWIAFWALVFGDRLLSDPLVLGWTVLLFGTLGGLSWWEIFYGKDARRERERARRRTAKSPKRPSCKAVVLRAS